ncbi:Uncharacterised protein [Mycobacteroides abscessus subsp. abscessus]|nr:Uncharacterised protein [Mycobacteroides abscessus subsp. abscessus]SKZ78866.1 Uncharacterised protein [Mycobacteroides abscessus subsp. abscessus]
MGGPLVSDAQCDTIGEALDHLSWRRSIGVVDRHPRADRLDEIRTCERRLFQAVRHRATDHLRVVHTGSPTRFSRVPLRLSVDAESPCVIGPCATQRRPCDTFGFPWPRGLLRGRQLPRGKLVALHAQMPAGPLAQLRGPRRPRPQLAPIGPGDVGHPGVRVDVVPLHADRTRQLPPQRGLVDDPGGLRFVIETRPVQRHQPPIRAGLPVRNQNVGVQMRVPGPRGFVLKSSRHDPRQPHQILLTRARIVHTGVAPVLGQILHRLGDREGVRIRDRFTGHVIAQTTHQRHALRRAERQVVAVHRGPLSARPTTRAARRFPVVQPPRHHVQIGVLTVTPGARQTPRRGRVPAGGKPHRRPRLGLAVVLAQTPTGSPRFQCRRRRLTRGVDVVRHRPRPELGDCQHRTLTPPAQTRPPPTSRERAHGALPPSLAQFVQMCHIVMVVEQY